MRKLKAEALEKLEKLDKTLLFADVYERYADQKEIRLTNTDSSSVKEALKVLEKNN